MKVNNRFFNEKSPAIGFFTRLGEMILLSLLFTLCSIPIITIGASLTAAATVVNEALNDVEGHFAKRFFKAFTSNFKQSTILWLIWGIMGFIFAYNTFFWSQVWVQNNYAVVFPFVFFCGFCFLFTASVIINLFPVIGCYKAKKTEQVKRALLMSFRKFPTTFLLFIIDLFCVWLMYDNIPFIIVFILIGFGIVAFIDGHFHIKCFEAINEYLTDEGKEDPKKNVTIKGLLGDDEEAKKESRKRAFAYTNIATDDDDDDDISTDADTDNK